MLLCPVWLVRSVNFVENLIGFDCLELIKERRIVAVMREHYLYVICWLVPHLEGKNWNLNSSTILLKPGKIIMADSIHEVCRLFEPLIDSSDIFAPFPWNNTEKAIFYDLRNDVRVLIEYKKKNGHRWTMWLYMIQNATLIVL